MPARPQKPLWSCPRCGAKLVTANMWHSCGVFELGPLFETCDPNVRETFDALRRAVEAVEKTVIVIPQKTRAVFQLRTRFISIYPRKRHLLVGFIFPEKSSNKRFAKIEGPITGVYIHYVHFARPEDVDAMVKGWIKAALPYGRQDRQLGKHRKRDS